MKNENISILNRPLEPKELRVSELKTGNICGADGVFNEQILHFGVMRSGLPNFFQLPRDAEFQNNGKKCRSLHYQSPKLASKPESYQPISLLSHALKLFEQLFFNHRRGGVGVCVCVCVCVCERERERESLSLIGGHESSVDGEVQDLVWLL